MGFVLPVFAAIGSAVSGATAAVGGVGSALSIGAGILGAGGALVQGAAGSQAGKYNAALQDQEAKVASDQAAYKAGQIAQQTRAKVANAQGAMLENGTEIAGSNVDLLNTIDTAGRLDALTAVYDGTVQSNSYKAQASLSRQSAGNSMLSGFIGAGTKIFSGVADAYSGKTGSASLSRQLSV